MRLANDSGACYFRSSTAFTGQKQGAYGQKFGVDLSYFVPEEPENFTYQDAVRTEGDVILRGAHTDYDIVTAFETIPTEERTMYEVRSA